MPRIFIPLCPGYSSPYAPDIRSGLHPWSEDDDNILFSLDINEIKALWEKHGNVWDLEGILSGADSSDVILSGVDSSDVI